MSSLAPSSGKVEAAENKTTSGIKHEVRSIPADAELNSYITKKSKNKITSLIILLPVHL